MMAVISDLTDQEKVGRNTLLAVVLSEESNKASNWQIVAHSKTFYPERLWDFVDKEISNTGNLIENFCHLVLHVRGDCPPHTFPCPADAQLLFAVISDVRYLRYLRFPQAIVYK